MGSENNWTVDLWLTGPKHQLSSENIHRHRAATARCVINHCCQVSVTCTTHYHRILFLSLLQFHFTHFPHSRTINPHQKRRHSPSLIPHPSHLHRTAVRLWSVLPHQNRRQGPQTRRADETGLDRTDKTKHHFQPPAPQVPQTHLKGNTVNGVQIRTCSLCTVPHTHRRFFGTDSSEMTPFISQITDFHFTTWFRHRRRRSSWMSVMLLYENKVRKH